MGIKQVCLDSDPNHMSTQNVLCCAVLQRSTHRTSNRCHRRAMTSIPKIPMKKKNLIKMINKLKTVNYQ